MYTIGITGPTGAGKTTALGVLEELGGTVVDCDAVYHRLLETDGELLHSIEAAFPGVVRDGALDRKALGARVYADPAALERLNAITWPAVRREAARITERSNAPFCVIDAIGLFESGLAELCDVTVAVVADEAVRVRRLMERDGIDEGYARARIAAQKPAAWFAERADLVLENNGTNAAFFHICRDAFAYLRERRTGMTDMCVPCGDGLVNIRVGAIIRKDGRLLMVRNRRDPYLYSVGGRVKLGETAAEAVAREVFEETGVRLAVDRLGYVHENYFYGDAPANQGKLIYELCFYFWMVVPEDFSPTGGSATADGLEERLMWVSPDTKQQLYPEFFRNLPDKIDSGIQFVQTDERK